MRDWLLFRSNCDGEFYIGAFETETDAKTKAVELWDGTEDFVIRRTSDDGFHVHGESTWKGESKILDWSDEDPTDLTGQEEKIARFKEEAEKSARARKRLLAKRERGEKLSLGETMACSLYDAQAQMFENLLKCNYDSKIVGLPFVVAAEKAAEVALASEPHPFDGGKP